MIFRNLDNNNDWEFGRGKQDFVTDNKAISLNIKTRIKSWVGDCFFDRLAGIDWNNRFGSKNQRELLDLDLRRVILQSEGVISMTKFDSFLNGRKYTADFEINTIFSNGVNDTLTIEV